MSGEPLIGAVVVAHRSADVLADCLAGVLADPHVLVAVVDNAAEQACADICSALGERVVYLDPGTNLGYGRAANRGVDHLQGMTSALTHVAVLNADVALTEPLSALVGVADATPGALVGASLEHDVGVNARPLVSVGREFGKAVSGSRAYRYEVPPTDAPVRVGQLGGALLLTTLATWRALGGFDEQFELFYEDVDLCARAPGGCLLVPRTWGSHVGGASLARNPTRSFVVLRVSRVRYLRKHHGNVVGGTAALLMGLVEFVARGVTRQPEGPAARRAALAAQAREWAAAGSVWVLDATATGGDVAPASARRRLPVAVQLIGLSGLVAGFQGLLALLLAKWLGAHDRGVLALAQTLVNVVVMALSLGLMASTRIVLSSPGWGVSLRQYVRATRPLAWLDLAVAAVVAWTVFPLLSRVLDPVLAAGFVVMALTHLRSGLLREGLHGVGWHRTAMLGEFAGAAGSLLLLCGLWVTGTLTLHTGMLAIVARPVLHHAFQAVSVARHVRGEPAGTARDDGLLRRLVRFSLPGLVVAGGAAVAGQVDRLLLGAFDGPAPVGVYASAAALAVLAGTLPSAVAPMIVRQVARDWHPGLHRWWWTRVMLGSVALGLVILAAGAFVLERWLGGEFAGSTPILGLLLLGGVAMASQQIDNAVNNGFGDLRASATTALVGVPVGLVAYLVLIPPYGIVGCALGNVVTYLSMAVVARLRLRRRLVERDADADPSAGPDARSVPLSRAPGRRSARLDAAQRVDAVRGAGLGVLLVGAAFPVRLDELGWPAPGSLFDVALVLALAAAVVLVLRDGWVWPPRPYLALGTTAVALAGASLAWTTDPGATVAQVVASAESLLALLVALVLLRGVPARRIATLITVWLLLLLIPVLLLQLHVPGFGPPSSVAPGTGDHVSYYVRLSHPFIGRSNNVAALVAPVVLPLIAIAVRHRHRLAGAGAALAFAMLVLTLSRGSLLTFGVCVVIYAVADAGGRRLLRRYWWSLALVVAVAAALVLALPWARARFVNRFDLRNVLARADLLEEGLAQIAAHPWWGIGGGAGVHVHNTFVQQALWYGIPLGVAVGGLLVWTVTRWWRVGPASARWLSLAIGASLAGQVLSFAVQSSYEGQLLRSLIWLGWGFLIALHRSEKDVP